MEKGWFEDVGDNFYFFFFFIQLDDRYHAVDYSFNNGLRCGRDGLKVFRGLILRD